MAQPGQHYIEDFFTKDGLDARLLGGHAQRLARRAAPHRLRRQGALGAARRVRRVQGRRRPRSCGRCCPTSPPSSSRRTGTRTTRAATASRWRRSSPSGMRSVEMKWKAIGYPMERDAARHLPASTPSCRTRSGPSARSSCSRPASSASPTAAPSLARGAGDLLRRRRPLGPDRRGRPAGHVPVAVRRRRPLAHPHRQRLDQRRAGPGPGRRRDAGDDLGRLDRHLDARRRPPQGDAAAEAAPARLAAPAARMQKIWHRARSPSSASPRASASAPRTRRR